MKYSNQIMTTKIKLDLNEYCIMVFIVYNKFSATMGVGSLKNVLFSNRYRSEKWASMHGGLGKVGFGRWSTPTPLEEV